jgi:putative ABC transport system permease protein
MRTKIIQIIYDMRHQPVIAWVTVLGTALSIFLILIVVMMQNVGTVNIAPETHRDRMLYGMYIHLQSISGDNNDSSAGLSLSVAKKLYADLDGVEHTSYLCKDLASFDVKGSTGETFSAKTRLSDAAFWDIYDHELVAGRFFTKEEADAETRVAVVSESAARRMFNSIDIVGRKFLCDHKTFTIVGIVKDSSLLASMACGEVFVPFPFSNSNYNDEESGWGDVTVAMLVKDGVSLESVRDQVKKRYAEYDTELAARNLKTVYHGAPFDQEAIVSGVAGSNVTPDAETDRNVRWCIYIILLLVPAINLSSMLHSRMTRRVSEIGVRRAYGCTRARIVGDIVVENMLVTLVGGVIGMVAAIVFAMFYDGIFVTGEGSVSPALGMIMNLSTLFAALVACLVLNLISAAVPAWHASRLNPVDAINSNHN